MDNRIRSAISLSLACGFIGFIIWRASYALPTTDWAAKGVPLTERLLSTTVHGLPGLLVGIIAGFILGMIIPQKIFIKLSCAGPEMVLKGEVKFIAHVFMLGFVFAYFHFFDPSILTVTINFILLALIYFRVSQVFGVPASSDEKENF